MSEFSESEQDQMMILIIWSGSIGVLACMISILIFICYKELHVFVHRLVLYMAISDLGSIVSLLISPSPGKSSEMCYIQHIMMNFFDLQGVLWVDAIALSIYLITLTKKETIYSLEKWFILSICSVSFVLGFLPVITDNIGETHNGYCWVTLRSDGNDELAFMWQFVVFYAWLWFSFIFCIFAIIKVHFYLSKIYEQQLPNEHTNFVTRLKLFPIILVAGKFFGTINRIYLYFSDDPNFVLAYLHVLFSNLIPVMNLFAYGLKGEIIDLLAASCRKRCKCCSKHGGEYDSPQIKI